MLGLSPLVAPFGVDQNLRGTVGTVRRVENGLSVRGASGNNWTATHRQVIIIEA